MVQPYYSDVSDYDMTDEESDDEMIKACSTGYIRSDFTVAGVVTCLNRIQLGTKAWNRVGRSIKMTHLCIRGQIGGGWPTFTDAIRMLVVYDRQTNGTTPAASAILMDYKEDGSTMTNSTSSINQANKQRFTVITDILNRSPATLAAAASNGLDSHSRFSIDCRVPLDMLRVQYGADSSPALVGDIQTGSLWLLTISKESNGQWGFYGTLTVEYDDQ